MRPLKARKNEYTFCDLESNVPKNAGLLMTGSHENAPVLFHTGYAVNFFDRLGHTDGKRESVLTHFPPQTTSCAL